MSSCLRCRPASTSAGPAPTQQSIVDRDDPSHNSIANTSDLLDSPSSAASAPSATIDFSDLRKRIDRLSAVLPPPHYIVNRSHKPVSRAGNSLSLSTVASLEGEVDALWVALEPIVGGKVSAESWSSTEQLDLVRLFRRATGLLPVPAQPSPLLRPREAREIERELERMRERRREAGRRMALLVRAFVPDPQANVEHPRSWALLRLEATCLADSLPSTLPCRPSTTTPASELTQLEADLLHVFPHPDPDPTAPSPSPRVIKAQWSAFSALLSAWARSDHGPIQAAHFVPNWGLDQLLHPKEIRARGKGKASAALAELFRRKYGEIVAQIQPSPTGWLVQQLKDAVEKGVNPTAIYTTGLHLIEHLANTSAALEALKVRHLIDKSSDNELSLPKVVELRVLSVLVGGLTFAGFEHDASALTRSLEALIDSVVESLAHAPNTQHEKAVINGYRALAKLAAARGRTAKVDQVLAALERIGYDAGTEGVARRMRAAAQQLDLDEVVKQYAHAENAYPHATEKEKGQLGTQLVWAQVRMDDVEGAISTLASLIRNGTKIPLALIATLLFGLARRKKADEAHDLFGRLADFGLVPNAVCFLALASLHANLAEPEAVQHVMSRMLAAGVEPDVRVWTTLMSAYVNLGQFTHALEVYAFLEQHKLKQMQPDTATVNVLLKATVLSAAPASASLRVFKQAVAKGIRPNAQTYTLVIQALSNAGLMDLAEELFTLMDSPHEGLQDSPLPTSMTAVRPDVFVFSTMIKGYLERRDAVKAQACLQEMRARGIDPSSITYGIIVGSLVKDRSDVGIKRAQELATAFMSADPDFALLRRHARPVTFDKPFAAGEEALNVVGPILNAFAKKADADQALTVFRHALNERSRPSVLLYTSLMDAYRRADSPENVELIWHRLHRLYLDTYPGPAPRVPSQQQAQSVLSRRRIAPSHATGLCHALSVYMDAHLGRDHIVPVKATWRKMVKQGFSFDAGNWNALALALLYAGEVSHAFRVVEKVLCRAPGETIERDVLELRFGRPERVESALQTNARLFEMRQPERDAHRKGPIEIQDLLHVPSMASHDAEVALADEVVQEVNSARDRRIASYWFPHGVVLDAIDRALSILPREQGGEEFRQRIEIDHPKTMLALRRRTGAWDRARRGDGPGESLSAGLVRGAGI